MFKIHLCGVNTTHTNGAHFISENLPNHLFMYSKTPFYYTVNGETFKGKAGDCLIHKKHSSVSHGPLTADTSFTNDWFYFSADSKSELEELQLVFDKALHTDQGQLITSLICEIIKETFINDKYSSRIISDKLNHLFIIFKRSISETKNGTTATDERLENLRTHIHYHYQKKWTLKQMADTLGYSVSRFCALYTEKFGISPMDDLLKVRVEMAKQFLKMNTYTIGDISTMCGFSSVHYFSKFFKTHTGMTPSQYINHI